MMLKLFKFRLAITPEPLPISNTIEFDSISGGKSKSSEKLPSLTCGPNNEPLRCLNQAVYITTPHFSSFSCKSSGLGWIPTRW